MNQEIILRTDKEWSSIDGELCLVTDFCPLMGSKVKNGVVISSVTSVPYASIDIKCRRTDKKVTGFITHKEDFLHLWLAFVERGIDKEKEEVLIYWSTKRYTSRIHRILSKGMPKVIVMVCPKSTYEKCLDGCPLRPEHEVLVFVSTLRSLSWWIPDVINDNKHFKKSI